MRFKGIQESKRVLKKSIVVENKEPMLEGQSRQSKTNLWSILLEQKND